MRLRISNRRIARSTAGDVAILIFLGLGAVYMALPMFYAICQAFKPLNELFIFPPQFLPRHPTLSNFSDLFLLMAQSWVPVSRYLFNSLFIVAAGSAGNVILGSLCAYALAKHDFKGRNLINNLILFSLMFAGSVLVIPRYLIISFLGWINTYAALVVPAWGTTLGVFLMRNFITHMVHDSLLEAARIDGASEWYIHWRIVMPIVKPAWLTLIILNFQQLWGDQGGMFIYSEELKPLPYALGQIIGGGVGRAGVAAAVSVILMAVPITVFVINQTKIVQTMGTSGITGE
ncbi:MAG: carbohydrate ABC transporter permease [Limnochordia bacterium]|jgi:ABC-type glycerol-3-phosphate transport system permease component|nr:carbohydrate ABC transporter permease [Bacillota bacterium]NLL08276.1 carbohydrate ABC transporter permease [Bacillota bacterium]HBG09304.1 carbohydrate ABC transporter permease [Bacillota bacterium]